MKQNALNNFVLKKPIALILGILMLDQALKFWIKTNLIIGEEIRLFDWFIIHFIENNGMAFGMEFGGEWGKYLLSIFRIIAIGAIALYLNTLVKEETEKV